MKKLLTKENLLIFVFQLIALHPLYEIDWCIESIFGIPVVVRLSTIINFIILPALVLIMFFMFEKDKKKYKWFILYAVVFIIYFIFHLKSASTLIEDIHLSYTFIFDPKDEIVYTITLLLPLVYIYIFNLSDLKEDIIKKTAIGISFVSSLLIIISNIFQFGYTTYEVEMAGNIFSWFSLPFNATTNHPRNYATCFLFKEGNTMGILLLMFLVFQYYFLFREENLKKKAFIEISIFTSSIAMFIIGTRVAAYGTIIIPIAVLVIYFIFVLFKKELLQPVFIVFSVLMTTVCCCIRPYSPAYQNQQFDAADYSTLKIEDDYRELMRNAINSGAEGFEPFSPEWVDYYVYEFEEYKFLVNVTPSIYYTYYYDYKVDPKFWVDLVFDYELEERINTRQVETIFYKYKWNNYMTPTQKMFGFTFGIFMRGGINIERDFIQQFYSYGYLGFPLVMGPWFVLFGYVIYLFIKSLIKKKLTFFELISLMSLGLGVVSGIISGHTFDELTTSMIISLISVMSIKRMKEGLHE